MNLERSALIVIDMQNGFVNDKSRHVVPVIAEVVEKWKSLGGAVVFTRFLNHPNSQYERLIHWSRMEASPEIDIVEELAPFVGLTIDKDYYSFFNEEAKNLIDQHKWDTFVFCGIASDSCVMKSAIDAFELGFTPWVIADATASHAGDEVHESGLLVIRRNIGRNQVIDTASLWSMVPIPA